jgi:hypothetical protein
MRDICIRALGMIGYAPAEAPLCEALRAESGRREGGDVAYLVPKALVGLGGELARATLAEAFPEARYPERVLAALFRLHAEGAREVATSLALKHRVSARVLAEALYAFDPDDLNRRPMFGDLSDPGLLDLLLAGADEMLASPRLERTHHIYAVARFRLPAAMAFLEGVAGQTSPAANEARDVLASLGNEKAIRALIDAQLRNCEEPAPFIPSFTVDRLSAWPAALVRAALLARIEKRAQRARWIFLLQWFARPEDIPLFRSIESEADISAADIAHEFLRGNRPVVRRRT